MRGNRLPQRDGQINQAHAAFQNVNYNVVASVSENGKRHYYIMIRSPSADAKLLRCPELKFNKTLF